MRRFEYLSYPYHRSNPVYGNPAESMRLTPLKSQKQGDSCNTYSITLENHWGTHVDCPAHFYSQAPRLIDYPCDFWIFRAPQVIDIQVAEGQIIQYEDLPDSIEPAADLLIIRTGWSKRRDEPKYCIENPGISPELAEWLRKERKNLKAIGFDFISVSSFPKRDIGRRAHQAFLCPDAEGSPILLIEDMKLPEMMEGLHEVWAVPWLVAEIDSAPCTVIGVFDD